MNRLNIPAPFCETSEFPGNLYVMSEEELQSYKVAPFDRKEIEEMEVSSGPESEIGSGAFSASFCVLIYIISNLPFLPCC